MLLYGELKIQFQIYTNIITYTSLIISVQYPGQETVARTMYTCTFSRRVSRKFLVTVCEKHVNRFITRPCSVCPHGHVIIVPPRLHILITANYCSTYNTRYIMYQIDTIQLSFLVIFGFSFRFYRKHFIHLYSACLALSHITYTQIHT